MAYRRLPWQKVPTGTTRKQERPRHVMHHADMLLADSYEAFHLPIHQGGGGGVFSIALVLLCLIDALSKHVDHHANRQRDRFGWFVQNRLRWPERCKLSWGQMTMRQAITRYILGGTATAVLLTAAPGFSPLVLADDAPASGTYTIDLKTERQVYVDNAKRLYGVDLIVPPDYKTLDILCVSEYGPGAIGVGILPPPRRFACGGAGYADQRIGDMGPMCRLKFGNEFTWDNLSSDFILTCKLVPIKNDE